MSLGDYLRYLRAMRGGVTPLEIMEETGIPPRILTQIEQRYREMGDDETLEKLAAYYEVPVEELHWRRGRSRKALIAFLARARNEGHVVRLRLRAPQEEFVGRVVWDDLGAVELRLAGGGNVVVQRHAVDDWELAEESTVADSQ